MYAASMVPEMPAKPTAINVWISESVNLLMYGLTRIRDSAWEHREKDMGCIKPHRVYFLIVISVKLPRPSLFTWPRNIVPAATTDSTGVVPMVTCIAKPI